MEIIILKHLIGAGSFSNLNLIHFGTNHNPIMTTAPHNDNSRQNVATGITGIGIDHPAVLDIVGSEYLLEKEAEALVG